MTLDRRNQVWEQAFFCEPPDPEPGETEVNVVECEGDTVATCATRTLADLLCETLNALPEDALPFVSGSKQDHGRKNLRSFNDLRLEPDEAKEVLSMIAADALEYGRLSEKTTSLRERLQRAIREETEHEQLARETNDPDSTSNIMDEVPIGMRLAVANIASAIQVHGASHKVHALAESISGSRDGRQKIEDVLRYVRRVAPMRRDPMTQDDPDDRAAIIGALLVAMKFMVRVRFHVSEKSQQPRLTLEVGTEREDFVIDLDALEIR